MLHEYQKTAARFLHNNPRSGLFANPGAGKTLTILAVLNRLVSEGHMKRCLIIAPLRTCRYVWPDEVKKWGLPFSTHMLHGKGRTIAHSGATIELINPEGLKWLTKNREPTWDVLVIDESSQFKNGRSVRFKLLKPWVTQFPRIHLMTGTPVPSGMMDFWSQIYIMDGGAALGTYITHFRRRYFHEIRFPNFSKYELRRGAEEEIWERIAPLVHRVDAKLDLPELVEHKIYVDLPPAARKIYRNFERMLAAEINGEMILTPSAATKYQICCQISSGAMYKPESDRLVIDLHSEKIDALKNLVSELYGRPLLVGFRYRHEGARIKKALKCPIIDGSTTERATDQMLSAWNAGKLPILAAQAQTISHGLNLQRGGCQDVCWFSLTDDWDRFEQFNRRVYRQGMSGSRCTIHYLLARNTIDSVILSRHQNHKEQHLALFAYLQQYFQKSSSQISS